MVIVKIRGDTDGDILRVVVAYQDANNYLYAEFEIGALGGTLRLFQVLGGSATQLGDDKLVTFLQEGELHDVMVCYDGAVLKATINEDLVYGSYAQPVTATGTRVGAATGIIDTLATFQDFEWWMHYEETPPLDECPQCPDAL